MSTGEQIRDYLPVDEVAARLAYLARRGRNDGIVNICSGQPISVRAQVERWISDMGADIRPELGLYPLPDYEPLAFWGNPARWQALVDRP
jgi:dTDP-6-deoxy-L-talose 4-dehydrogenase (NAD+)